MLFQRLYLPCLAHASYFIASEGDAAVVDPRRDVDEYLTLAREHGVTIRYIIETHLHADFVSGHQELAARTGATIVIGAAANAAFPHHPAHDGDVLRLGAIELHAWATPGHTPESISWLLVEDGTPRKVLTGDTLFIGDAGRPDLAGARGYTAQEMASMLYDSLGRLMTLPDDVEVWPAHGAGSACGRNISRESSSTIGEQRRTNHALAPMSREEFVNMMTIGLAAPPRYFPHDVELNRRGARPLAELSIAPATSIGDAIILDVRSAAAFGAGHIRGAINIGLDGQFASWCGTLLPVDAHVVVFAESIARANEARMRLARIGYERVDGYLTSLDGHDIASLPQLAPENVEGSRRTVVDVRGAGEFASGAIDGAINIPLPELAQRLAELDREAPLAIVCAGGYRSSAAASLLARNGFRDLADVTGGMNAFRALLAAG